MNKVESNNQNNKPHQVPPPETPFNISGLIGAIFIYLINFGSKKFNLIYSSENSRRNAWIGWLAQMALIGLLIYLGISYS